MPVNPLRRYPTQLSSEAIECDTNRVTIPFFKNIYLRIKILSNRFNGRGRECRLLHNKFYKLSLRPSNTFCLLLISKAKQAKLQKV